MLYYVFTCFLRSELNFRKISGPQRPFELPHSRRDLYERKVTDLATKQAEQLRDILLDF